MALTLSPIPVLPQRSEPELVAATRAGDDRAFEALYARYQERIFAFIASRVHDHGRAEDIAQEVFISALRRMRAGDQEIAFKPWIYEIAKNACIDEFRRGSRSREVPFESEPEIPADRPATVSALPTPTAAVESKQRMADLRGAFGGLSETHHQLLVLREFEGLSYDEIGERLDMSRQMVESSLFRARRKLAEEYQELASGRRCQQVQSAIEAGSLTSARALGIRDRRRFARHLSHCQPCRHVALMTGVDEALVRPRSIAAKIAALLPFPLAGLRWPWGRGKGAVRASAASHPLTAAAQNAPVLAEQAGGSAVALAPVAAAALAIAGVGIGGGIVYNSVASGHTGTPANPSAAKVARPYAHRTSAAGATVTGATARPVRRGVGQSTGQTGAPAASRSRSVARTGTGATHSPAGSSSSTATGRPAAGTASRRSSLPVRSTTATAPLKQVVSGATGAVGKTLQGVTGTASKAVQGVTNTASKTVQGVANTASKAVQGVTNAASGAVQGVTNAASGAVQGVTNTASKTVQGVTNTASKTVQGVTNGVQQATSGLTSPPASGSAAGSASTSGASGVIHSVQQATGGAGQAVGQAGQAVGQTTQAAHGLLP